MLKIKQKKSIWKWYMLLCISILILAILIFHQYIIDGYYFFSKGLWSDLLRANLPSYYQMFDSMADGGNFWSWRMGIGTSMFSHGDIYFDPFTYILFIFGRNHIPDMMVWLMVIKLIFEGMAFFAYLNYFKLDKRAGVIASVIYAFSGCSLIFGNNFALGTILVYAPIVLLGIEKWLDTGKLKVLILGLFLTAVYSYYFFFVLGLLTVIYVCVRLYQRGKNPIPKLFVLLGIAIFVVLLSSISLIPQMQLTLSSPRVSEAKDVTTGLELWIPQFKVFATAFIRTLSNDILGNSIAGQYQGYSYFGARDYFSFSCYTTSFFVILVTQYWHNEKKQRKNLRMITILIMVMILFPVVSFVLNACSIVNARWAFIVTIMECLLVGVSIDSILKNNGFHGKSLLAGILVSIGIILCGMALLSSDSVNFEKQFFSYLYNGRRFCFFLIVSYIALFVIYGGQHLKKSMMKKIILYTLVIGIIFIDEGINYYHCYGIAESVSEYSEMEETSYQDTSAEIIQEIQQKDEGFYRINKTFDSVIDNNGIPSLNDAMVQQYYGLKNYNSLNNSKYITFLQKMGIYCIVPIAEQSAIDNGILPEEIVGVHLNYVNGVGNRYNLMNYFGVKYFISKESSDEIPQYFHNINNNNQIHVYENDAYYPLGFVNTKTMSLQEFDTLSNEDKDYALLEYTIVNEGNTCNSPLLRGEQEVRKLAEEKQNAFQLISFAQDRVLFQIDVPAGAKYLSLSMPFDSDWHIYIDDEEVDTCEINVTLLGAEITEGLHKVELRYQPKAVKLGLILTIFASVLLIVLWKSAGSLMRKLEENINSGILYLRKIIESEKLRKGIVLAAKYLMYAFVAFSLTFVSVLVLRPTTFMKSEKEVITDFSGMAMRRYQVDQNHFLVTKDDPGMEWENHLTLPVCSVTVHFNSIDITKLENGKMKVQLFYHDEEERYSEQQSLVGYVSQDEPMVQFEMDTDNISNFRLDIGISEKEEFQLASVQVEAKDFKISTRAYLFIGFISLLVFVILLAVTGKIKKKTANDKRESNIELCRVVCMLLIIAHHCILHGGAYNMPGMTFNRIFSLFLVPGGKLCFDCFLAISCWYLVDQSFRTKRFLKIWFQVLFYSILFSLIAFGFGTNFAFRDWLSILLPISGNSHGFAASYLAFYLLLPFLSFLSERLTKKQARWLLVLILYFEVGSTLIGAFTGYYQPLSSELTLFVLCYVIALNLKRWPLKICDNGRLMFSIFAIIWFGLWIARYSSIQNPANPLLNYFMGTMCDESSITNLIGGFALFFCFKNIKIRKNPVINYLATGTFGILLMHDHNFFRYVLWNKVIMTQEWYTVPIFVILVASVVIWIYVIGFIIDRIRTWLAERLIDSNVRLNTCCDKWDRILKGEEKE